MPKGLNDRQCIMLEEIVKTVGPRHPKGNIVKAYEKAYGPSADMPKERKRVLAYRARKRIYNNAQTQQILEGMGLGLQRFGLELDQRLREESVVVYQGEVMKQEGKAVKVPNGTVRMQATSLLGDVLGVRQKHHQMDVNITKKEFMVVLNRDESEHQKQVQQQIQQHGYEIDYDNASRGTDQG